jgi:histidinol phosphatase-like PHP family hydrolase
MEYKYYLREFDKQREIYRCIKNEKKFAFNTDSLEKFEIGETWTNETIKLRGVILDSVSGWFSDDDEITEIEALKLMNEINDLK